MRCHTVRITRYLTIWVGHIPPGTSLGKTAMENFIENTKSADRKLRMCESICKTIACVGNSSLKGIAGGNFYRGEFIGFIIIIPPPVKYRPVGRISLAQLLAEGRKGSPLYVPYVKYEAYQIPGGASVIC